MIKAPNWQPNATPTTSGWVHKGELIKSQRISESDINAYNGVAPTLLQEAPSNNKSMEDMSKREINELSSHHDVAAPKKKKSLFGRKKKTTKKTLSE
jgi:hypothetical protein